MGSKRLPNKIIKKIGNLTILEKTITRIKKVKKINKIIVATSKDNNNYKVLQICKKKNVDIFLGEEENVASRFFEILKKNYSAFFLRINADSPFIDPKLIDKMINSCDLNKYDLITNVLPRTFPKGQSVEIIKSNIFINNYNKFISKEDFEHVTSYFYKKKKSFKIFNFKSKKNLSKINLCVDTDKDLIKLRRINKNVVLKKQNWENLVLEYQKLYN